MNLIAIRPFLDIYALPIKSHLLSSLCEAQVDISGQLEDSLLNSLHSTLFDISHKAIMSMYMSVSEHVSFEEYAASLVEEETFDYVKQRFPVLHRRLKIACTNWLRNTLEILRKYKSDEAIISEQFLFGESATITAINYGAGDTHRGGKTVAIIYLSNEKKIVYKPRSLDIDEHFSDLLSWVNDKTIAVNKVPKTISRDNYGWCEFISFCDCAIKEQIERYYYRLGILTSLIYSLGGTDFHYENIICHGEFPILVDLESFFHPSLPRGGLDSVNIPEQTVLNTGVVPAEFFNENTLMPEISGLSDAKGIEGIFQTSFLVDDGKGGVKFTFEKGELQGAQNIPTLNGNKVKLNNDYIAKFKSGFECGYRAILDNKSDFINQLSSFEQDTVRVLLRNTACYSYLLTESNHPEVLSSEEKMQAHFAKLAVTLQDYEVAKEFIDIELKELNEFDVPMFDAKANSKTLNCGQYGEIEHFFEKSGFEQVIQNLEKFSESDLGYQLWVIDKALGYQVNKVSSLSYNHLVALQQDSSIASIESLAIGVGDYIIENSFSDDRYANWIVSFPTSLDNSSYAISNSSFDLYNGLAGELIFLEALYNHTDKQKYKVHAEKVRNSFEKQLRLYTSDIDSLGLFIGWGSVIRTHILLDKYSGDMEYLSRLEEIIKKTNIEVLLENCTNMNLVKGLCGFLQAACEWYTASKSKLALSLAKLAANQLIKNRHSENSWCWRISSKVPLTGMAHGASGFAMAFASLYKITQEEQYKEIVLGCLEYEKINFVSASQNWRDMRDIVTEKVGSEDFCSTAWSHGAPGIGMSRITLLNAGIDNEQVREDIDIAMSTLLNTELSERDSLVFGNFGNLDLFICYQKYLGNKYDKEINIYIKNLFEQRKELVSGSSMNSFGLMSGVTGIGYQCLRLLDSKRTPSILSAVDLI